MRHTRTDPACVKHRPPHGRLGRCRFDRYRGKSCRRCCPPARITATLTGEDTHHA